MEPLSSVVSLGADEIVLLQNTVELLQINAEYLGFLCGLVIALIFAVTWRNG